jgi:Na+/H+ antiporter NhaD/arsenite permease-like protein
MAVEWDTLLFFAALFVVVEGVSEMGLLRFIATTLSVSRRGAACAVHL